jgi:putative transposase
MGTGETVPADAREAVHASKDGLRRAYVYRLEPTKAQAHDLDRTLGICRWLYNLAVEQRYAHLAQCRIDDRGRWRRLTWYDQKRELKDLRPAGAWRGLLDVPSIVLQDVLLRVDRAFERWSWPDASGRRFGRPRFQSARTYDSWTYALLGNGVSLRGQVTDLHGQKLRLFHIGDVRVRWHRPLAGVVKTITIQRKADGWYVIFSCAEIPTSPLPPTGRSAALDVRVASFATLDDGTEIGNPRFYTKARRKLRLAQRRLARRQKGSKNREKARQLLEKAHLKVTRQRSHFHHTTARELVQHYDTIYREDLAIRTLLELRDEELPLDVRRARNQGMHDSGWGTFFDILDAKAEETGRQIVAVNPAYTTRACSECGHVPLEPMRQRIYVCPVCGYQAPRAHNAARNVLKAGQEGMS